MIEPKEITLKTQDGKERKYIIYKWDAISGRELVAKYPSSNLPKIGDYNTSEEVMLKLMTFCAVVTEAGPLVLSTRELVKNHVPDWETLARLEFSAWEYNCSFFGGGLNSAFLESISQKAVAWITQTLTQLSASSSQTTKPPSVN